MTLDFFAGCAFHEVEYGRPFPNCEDCQDLRIKYDNGEFGNEM